MKNSFTYLNILMFALLLGLFVQCKKEGFNRDEVKRITAEDSFVPMRIYTIDNKSDSLFLRKKARDFDKRHIESKILHQFKKRLLATVSESTNGGVGIAAPQVGVGIRMIYIQRFDKQGNPFELYYNPVIVEFGDSINSGAEGCMSVPDLRANVERYQQITIKYLDSLGVEKKEIISDFTAVIFQHEIDHLNGIFFFDHIFQGFE